MTNKPLIVLLSGKQGSGKSAAAGTLRTYFDGYGFRVFRVRFAEPIYQMHDAVWDLMQSYGFQKPEIKDGPLLQLLGTEWGRNTRDKDIWAKACLYRVSKFMHNNALITIEDCRFENEFDMFPDAVKIRLIADPEIRKARCSMWRKNYMHASEIDLDNYEAEGRFDLVVDTGLESKEVNHQKIIDFCRERLTSHDCG